ncbi:DUF3176 domain-containing protein [Candidatus Bathyarchaeota archaeon]|nr:DUF3176 domain-containing protein [Candidatus Bathyarchaeota archaeon]
MISQAKWPWFRQARPLRHIGTFDLASRGAWGSVQLLFINYKP